MSSCLCEKAEGTVPPFVLFVVAIEGRTDNSNDALDVDEADHRASSSAQLDKAALDDIGSAQLPPKGPGKVEEGEQLGQVLLQPFHYSRVDGLSRFSLKRDALSGRSLLQSG